ncbi:fibronectin type III domain-containing protein [Allokutzneria sp. A3M-2-11 16]|uniref:fibronectin type III domain-containing protein n=1 Tax=Allokutzneria sp. A3M-2-11 16 TaxID=2962043 RepID=UPI0020B6C1CB|nr:fibronectin type III domain-containing protein [Allokutzneria sp. A3M-2-11 16]MCP3803988.1 fibronectin type III domain-containing protein [Allokutzneria sp. A3M-2-11 16]
MLRVLLALLLLTGCSGGGTSLSAKMLSPNDIALEWRGGSTTRVLEFATEREGAYTVLHFAPPGQTTFTHPDLMPKTPFYYRLRSVHGPASAPLDLALPPGEFDETADHSWAPPQTLPGAPRKHPVRSEAAQPTDVRATVMHANGIRFTWTDNASDEAGYLIEVRAAGAAEYRVAAVLDPDVNSFGLITLPEEKVAAYRVRAYFYGSPSNIVHLVTGA